VSSVSRTVLPSGLRIVVDEMPAVRSVSVGLWLAAGSRHEPPGRAGISHFLEHLFFKGTQTRSAREIAETIDAVGGHLNAYTSREYTCYYAKVLDEHLPVALDLLSDLVLRPRLAADDIEKERGVILEEIKLYEDTPEDLVHDVLSEGCWPGHSLGRPIQGSVQTVASMSRDDLLAHYRAHYVAPAAVVAVAGNVDARRVTGQVAEAFSPLPAGAPPAADGTSPRFSPGTWVRRKPIEQVHLCLGAPGAPLTNQEESYAAQLLVTILGGGSSSRLFQEIRDERGLAYSVYAYANGYRDAGLVAVYAGTSPGQLHSVLQLMLAELEAVRRDGVRPDELRRARNQLKGNLMLGLESTSSRAAWLGRSELLLGRILTLDEMLGRIDAVTDDDLAAFAGRLVPVRLGVAAVGPLDDSGLAREIEDLQLQAGTA